MSRKQERPTAEVRTGAAEHPAAVIARNASAVVRSTSDLQQEAARQLRMATNPAELMNVQAAMLMAGWQHSLQCTSNLAQAWFALGTAGALPRKPPTH